MASIPTYFFLIPVFNEEENMPDLMASLKETQALLKPANCRFILLNDGSRDQTVSEATRLSQLESIPLDVVSNPANQGPGAAFANGFQHISSLVKNEDLVITMEGDNTSRVELLRIMIERLHRENYDVVLASPYAYGGGFQQTSFVRMFLSHSANGMTKFFLKLHGIHTFSSFFRVFRASAITNLQKSYGNGIVKRQGFECMIELLAKAVHLHLQITEVPMRVDWSKRKGKSKMKIFKTIRGYFSLFWMARELIFAKPS